jgi:hypothetical protein
MTSSRPYAALSVYLLTILAGHWVAPSAFADAGAIEINDAKAVAGGLNGSLVDDPAGYPVVITQSGAYVLTGNLSVANAGDTAIEVLADDVSVDLRGFSLSGVVTCSNSGSALSCSATGGGFGIAGSTAARMTVRNGTVRGFANAGLYVGSASVVEHVTVVENGGHGIRTGGDSSVRYCTSSRNFGSGVLVADRAFVEHCRINRNLVDGVETSGGFGFLTVRNNEIWENGVKGIDGNQSAVIEGNRIRENEGQGIDTTNGAIARGNTVEFNGGTGIHADHASGNVVRFNDGVGIEGGVVLDNLVRGNDQDGIVAIGNNPAVISRNQVVDNGTTTQHDQIQTGDVAQVTGNVVRPEGPVGWGMRLGASAGYANNSVSTSNPGTGSPQGTVTGGVDAGGNVCAGTVGCP